MVSGILAKSQNLCKLQVRLCLADFDWSEDQILSNTKSIVSPFERLRNVRQPHIGGVYSGRPYHNTVLSVQRTQVQMMVGPSTLNQICSVPPLPIRYPKLVPGDPSFDAYEADWGRWISSSSSAQVTKKAPIRAMFTEFKDFYSKLSIIVPDITYRNGRHAFLHRARVAREQEDIESFRDLRNELIEYWYTYIDQEERKKADMNKRLSRMLDTDIYPSHEREEPDRCARRKSSVTQAGVQSPVLLNVATMAKEGIPMTGNVLQTPMPFTCMNPLLQIKKQQQMQMQQLAQQTGQSMAQAHGQIRAQAPAQAMARHMAAQTQGAQYLQMNTTLPGQNMFCNPQSVNGTASFPPFNPTLPSMPSMQGGLNANPYASPTTGGETECQITKVRPQNWVDLTSPVETSTDNAAFHGKRESLHVVGEPGPSTKRRRLDSGYEEPEYIMIEDDKPAAGDFEAGNAAAGGEEEDVPYVGKGKGKVTLQKPIYY